MSQVLCIRAGGTASPGVGPAAFTRQPDPWTYEGASALVSWPTLAAHAAALLQETRAAGYLSAQRAIGSPPGWILTRHILPAVAGPVARYAVLRLPGIALALASLGFLGLGAQPPAPEWGLTLAESLPYVERAPWAVLAPAAMRLLLAAFAVSLPTRSTARVAGAGTAVIHLVRERLSGSATKVSST